MKAKIQTTILCPECEIPLVVTHGKNGSAAVHCQNCKIKGVVEMPHIDIVVSVDKPLKTKRK
jgi:transcription elongation factor Elf1